MFSFWKPNSEERLEEDWKACHGRKGDHKWEKPRLVAKSSESSRADQGNHIKASEYMDEPNVLNEKVNRIVEMLKKAKCCTAYTGAGLSRESGIGDYASKSNSINSKIPKLKSPLDAQPTYSHRVLVALEREGYLHHYVQQNHDGLPQKAGFPVEKINEIHGAWYDPSNPVVQFSGNLRGDFFDWMIEKEKETDLCLCLGTSLSGMNADRMAETPAEKSFLKKSNSLGTIIINLQQTRLDSKSSIRVWAKLDDTFKLIAEKLFLIIENVDVSPPKSMEDKFLIPYNEKGMLDWDKRMVWNLQDKSKIVIVNPEASNYKKEGYVVKKDKWGDYIINVGNRPSMLGKWWAKSTMKGSWPFCLPFVNVNPVIIDASDLPEEDFTMEEKEELTSLSFVQSVRPKGDSFEWSISLKENNKNIRSVTYELHPTFVPSKISFSEAPFEITRTGWGVFPVKITVTTRNGKEVNITHELSFDAPSQTQFQV